MASADDAQVHDQSGDDPAAEIIDEASDDSFPASDPPSWTTGTDEDAEDVIPDFRFPSSTGQTLSRSAYWGKVKMAAIVLDDHEGDEVESVLQALGDHFPEFGRRSCQLLVFMPATATVVRAVAERLELRFPILADPTNLFARAGGAASATGEPIASALIADRHGTVQTRMRGLGDGFVDSLLESIDRIAEVD